MVQKRMSHHFDPKELQKLLKYDPETGALTWRPRPEAQSSPGWNTKYAGKPALQTLHSDGYRMGTLRGKRIYAHRTAWAVAHGRWPDGVIDHINGDRSDNRLSNLRDTTPSENAKNVRDNLPSSGVQCVWWTEGCKKWRVSKTINGRRRHLGLFDDLEQAVKALEEALKDLDRQPQGLAQSR